MDFQPSGWISNQLACHMVGFPSMLWLILPSVHYKARKVENRMVTWKYKLAMIFFKQKNELINSKQTKKDVNSEPEEITLI